MTALNDGSDALEQASLRVFDHIYDHVSQDVVDTFCTFCLPDLKSEKASGGITDGF